MPQILTAFHPFFYAMSVARLATGVYAQDAHPVVLLYEEKGKGVETAQAGAETKIGDSIYNIHKPSLTIYLPPAGKATGCAVMSCRAVLMNGSQSNMRLLQWLTGSRNRALRRLCSNTRLSRDKATPQGAVQPYTIERDELGDAQTRHLCCPSPRSRMGFESKRHWHSRLFRRRPGGAPCRHPGSHSAGRWPRQDRRSLLTGGFLRVDLPRRHSRPTSNCLAELPRYFFSAAPWTARRFRRGCRNIFLNANGRGLMRSCISFPVLGMALDCGKKTKALLRIRG